MKQKRWRPIMLMILTVLLVMPLIWVANNYIALEKALDKMTTTTQSTEEITSVVSAAPQKDIVNDEDELQPFSVLLLGVDERDNDVGRSDTMIVVTVNPAHGTMKMLSLPRDTRTKIIGRGTIEKMNHAYAYGGVDMAVATVENFLQIPIDFYVQVNMEGFLQLVDTFDGVTVQNDYALTYKQFMFAEGPITLSGEEALVYSRIRYEDPRGDFGRQTRQRLLLQAILAEAKHPATVLLKLDNMLAVLGDNIRMNFTTEQLLQLIPRYAAFDEEIEQLQLQNGHGETIDGLWYYIADEQERLDVQQKLLAHLQQ